MLGVGQLPMTSPPSDTHREVMQNPMYAPAVTIRDTSTADMDQVVGAGQFAKIQPPPRGRVITNAVRGSVFTPGQGQVASINARPVKQVHSPATFPASISPAITKDTTAAIFAPGTSTVPEGERDNFYSPGNGPIKRK